jgi:hypothetical protein
VRFADLNQDGKQDILVFSPVDAIRVFIQGEKGEFTDLSAAAGYRRGLVDNLDAAGVSVGDVDGDQKPELIISSGNFARALRLNEKNELTVVDQFNARDSVSEIIASFVLPRGNAQKPWVVLYDRKTEQFQSLEANAQALYSVVDTSPAGKIDVVGTDVVTSAKSGTEAFVFGKDRFWWIPLTRSDLTAVTVSTHATDLPDIRYSDVIAGDFNGDGVPEIICVDPDKNTLELLARDAEGRWDSRMHFKVFETDEHFQGRKGPPQEPRETIIADVTGDGKKDLILLVHDRILVYPQE